MRVRMRTVGKGYPPSLRTLPQEPRTTHSKEVTKQVWEGAPGTSVKFFSTAQPFPPCSTSQPLKPSVRYNGVEDKGFACQPAQQRACHTHLLCSPASPSCVPAPASSTLAPPPNSGHSWSLPMTASLSSAHPLRVPTPPATSS